MNGVYYFFTNVYDVLLDRVFFDADTDEDMLKLVSFLEKRNIKHVVVFSGTHWHVYVHADPLSVKGNVESALLGAHHYFSRQVDGDELFHKNMEKNVRQKARTVGTKNSKSGKFVTSVKDPWIFFDENWERKKDFSVGKAPSSKIHVRCEKLYKFNHYRTVKKRTFYPSKENRNLDEALEYWDRKCPALRFLVENGVPDRTNGGHDYRIGLLLAMRHAGVSEDDIVDAFRNNDDFNERKTRYQMKTLDSNHISKRNLCSFVEESAAELCPWLCRQCRREIL